MKSSTGLRRVCPVPVSAQREYLIPHHTLHSVWPWSSADACSAPGLVFWFADAEAASSTKYPPTTFRWIDNQKEAEEAVEAAKRKLARRLAQEESGED
jgi:6-phosphogluconolactonase